LVGFDLVDRGVRSAARFLEPPGVNVIDPSLLCAVVAAKRLGAGRIIALSRHADRQKLARVFGATDIVEQRGEQATETVMQLTQGVGVDATLECVGTGLSMETALSIARPGSMVGYVGVPHGVEFKPEQMFFRTKGVLGGPAPARTYIPELLDDVLEGRINPSRVFDFETELDGIPEAYAAMDERRAIKSLVRVAVT
jgi:threonine dehydrogenase-like Zn-dependent dehydrogenase